MKMMKKISLAYISILFFNLPVHLCAQEIKVKFLYKIDLSPIAANTATTFSNLSVSDENRIYLVDSGLNRIILTDSLGRKQKEVGGFGWELEQFDQPNAIWAENALDVFVADYNNSRIQRFDRNLNFVTALIGDEVSNADMVFAFPVAVAWSRFGDLFIIESELNRVLQFDEIGEAVNAFGDFDEGAGQLISPVDLCVSDDEKIFVADQGRHAIMKFDYYGNFLQELTLHSLSQLDAIIWQKKKLFLLDGQKNQVTIASENGDIIVDFTPVPVTEDKKSSQLTDLCMQKNHLYILDDTRKMIHVYIVSTWRK
ncbi:MAG: hypothetical protein DWQ10_14190 [Calditrichaeota bacterium]|nr:MAG: hypothetical protein DWQ10_14190 [Calditrichota bacterium]